VLFLRLCNVDSWHTNKSNGKLGLACIQVSMTVDCLRSVFETSTGEISDLTQTFELRV